ncbi:MAG: hypothetical protein SPK37_09145, partial [Candidatus Limisoma sp.]|nr:hypothetical protein [Candidatus Limisoma sp.]
MKSQKKKLNQMSLEILKVFSEEELVNFNNRKAIPIMCELTVQKDGKIVNTTLLIPAKFSDEVSDQKLWDIKEIITGQIQISVRGIVYNYNINSFINIEYI